LQNQRSQRPLAALVLKWLRNGHWRLSPKRTSLDGVIVGFAQACPPHLKLHRGHPYLEQEGFPK
jgi:hypothetical protein